MGKLTKHTPGPWSMSGDTTRDGLPSVLIYGAPEGMLAIVRTAHQGGYYGHANANLIAAAPDLLAALESILKLAEDFEFTCLKANGLRALFLGTPPVSDARLALAKAYGDTEAGRNSLSQGEDK